MLKLQTAINKQPSTGSVRAIRCTLHHINGEQSEIVMIVPRYTDWLEYMEEAQAIMREYVLRLSSQWVKISHFDTAIGSFDQEGLFRETFTAVEDQIPLNKVYAIGNSGEWVDAEQHPSFANYGTGKISNSLQSLAKVVSERKEEVYHAINDEITLCGIPLASKHHYFPPGEVPKSTFLYNGREYLTVYQFVKPTSQSVKGGALC